MTHSGEPNIDRYWAQFLESLPTPARPAQYCDVFSFGTTKENAKSIAALVLSGIKTATGSLQWVYEAEGRQPPKQGDYSIVTDGEGHPLCVIVDTEVRIVPYDEVDSAFAWDGGEEDRSLESWRQIYWDYIVSECGRIRREPTLKTPLVCEHFRVVYREWLRPEGPFGVPRRPSAPLQGSPKNKNGDSVCDRLVKTDPHGVLASIAEEESSRSRASVRSLRT